MGRQGLRSIGMANQVVAQVREQGDFDEIFTELFNLARKVVMSGADAIEKACKTNPAYLCEHKTSFWNLAAKQRILS